MVQRLYRRGQRSGQRHGCRVIASAKKTFFAGGNLKTMVQATRTTPPAVFAMGEAVKAGCVVLETSGAGRRRDQRRRARWRLEITLACNHRIAVDDDSVKIGLPESTLGLLPGGAA